MQDDIDMEPLHKLFIYRKKLVKPYIERLLKWMDGITYMMSALFILTLVYEHGFLISFEEMEMINTLYHFVWIVFLVDISLHLLLNYSDTKRKYRGLAWILSLMLYLTLIPVIFHEPEVQGGIHDFWSFFHCIFPPLIDNNITLTRPFFNELISTNEFFHKKKKPLNGFDNEIKIVVFFLVEDARTTVLGYPVLQ